MSAATGAKNIPLQNKYDRVVLLVDMDCFYCQVEEKLDPSLQGQPLAVVQYNAWRGGGIIAVNYAARGKGVTRHMRGDEAKEQCPEIQLVKVPNVREKADLSKYRDAGKEVASVLQRYTPLLERASVDEAYLDISAAVNKRLEEMNAGSFVLQPNELHNTYAVGYDNIGAYIGEITAKFAEPYSNEEAYHCAHDSNDVPAVRKSDIRLLIGASIASEIRAAVKQATSYECSAGIAHNKILAKLACGMNKPNKQTILPLSQIATLFETLPVGKIKGLGAKFGEELCEKLNIRYLGQLMKFTESELQRKFDEKNGSWLYYIARGIDLEAVTPRFYSKSIGCCKKFPGRNNITGLKTLNHWLNELANEISERLEKDISENNRRAKQMVVSYIQEFDGEEISSSRSAPLLSYEKESLAKSSLDIIKANTKQFLRTGSNYVLNNPLKFLGISVGKFETINNAQSNLQKMFANQAAKQRPSKVEEETGVEKDPQLEQEPVEVVKSGSDDKNKSFLLNYLAAGSAKKEEIKEKVNAIVIEQVMENNIFVGEQKKSIEKKSFIMNYLENSSVVKRSNLKSIQSSSSEAEEVKKATIESISFSTENRTVNNEEKQPSIGIAQKSFFLKAFRKKNNDMAKEREELLNDSEQNLVEDQKSFFIKALKQKNTLEAVLCEVNKDNELTDDLDNLENDIQLVENETNIDNTEIILSEEYENAQNHNSGEISKTQIDSSSNNHHINPQQELKGIKRKHVELNDTSVMPQKTSTFNYEANYAEYAIPELRPELIEFTVCSICNARMPADERSMQMHQDHHFAQQLSQQQRTEFRKEITTKISAVKSPIVANKKHKKSKDNNAGITKFFTQPETKLNLTLLDNAEPSTSCEASADNEAKTICSECKMVVPNTKLDEHKDFHIAKELQRKLNQLEVRTVAITKKPSSSANGQRRKLNSSSTLLNTTNKKIAASKPITQFFTQPNS